MSIWDQWVNQEHLHISLNRQGFFHMTEFFAANIDAFLVGLYQVMKVWKKLEDNEQFDTHRTACDSYNHPDLDVNALKEMGAKSYKFSISWPRILPTGKNDEINHNGRFPQYNRLDIRSKAFIEKLLKALDTILICWSCWRRQILNQLWLCFITIFLWL